MKTVGRHLVAEFYDCSPSHLDDIAWLRELMLEAAGVIGASVLGDLFRRFEPKGVTGVVVIAESHLSLHTWPRDRYAAVDIFTCGQLDPRPGFRRLGDRLEASSCRVQETVRGLPHEVDAARSLLPADVEVITHRPVITWLKPEAHAVGGVPRSVNPGH